MSDDVKWSLCILLKHQYYTVQELTGHSRRIACERCKESWGMNDDTKTLLIWDNELASMYFDLFGITEIKPWR